MRTKRKKARPAARLRQLARIQGAVDGARNSTKGIGLGRASRYQRMAFGAIFPVRTIQICHCKFIRTLTIVLLLNPAPFGGLETVALNLATGLRALGTPFTTVALLDDGDQEPRLLSELARDGVPLEIVRVRPRQYLAERERIRSVLRKLNARVVHTHGYRMDVMTRSIIGGTRMRWVSTLHGFTGGNRKNRLFEALQLRALRRADVVIGVSRPILTRAVASGVKASATRLVRNALPASSPMSREAAKAELGLSSERRWVGWVGRLGAEKDPVLFAKFIRQVDDPSVGGVIVGDGPLRALIETDFADLIQSGRLILAGARIDAGRLMTAFDALVVSSVTEGTPMVVLEAMQCGVPVVAMAVGGLPDIVGEGAGLLVTERSGRAIGAAVVALLNDGSLRTAVVTAAQQRIAEQFSAADWLSAHLQIYTELSGVNFKSDS